ncbi:MAG: hypothetical protein KAT29_11100 [Anaerolineales bacterium]|nr:hypothetical protein [Anaerolineales bacterium]
MSDLPQIDSEYLLNLLINLLNTPSPTGFTGDVIDLVSQTMAEFPFLSPKQTRKGALIATWEGSSNDSPRALTAHADTLGAMVKEIKSNGRLKLTRIGGFAWNTVEGEGCTIFTYQGNTFRGSILLSKASSHVHGSKVNDLKREDSNMEVRLDARTMDADQTRDLGIQVGDFVALFPRVEALNGFVRSRHLDDKACVA